MRFITEPRSCCCCISPRTGTLIIGFLALFLGVLTLMFVPILFYNFVTSDSQSANCIFQESGATAIQCYYFYMGQYIITELEAIFRVAAASALIFGVFRRKPSLMLPFLIYQIATAMLSFLNGMTLIIVHFVYCNWHIALMVIFTAAIIIPLWIHFYMVVRVCRDEIRRQNQVVPYPDDLQPVGLHHQLDIAS